MKTSGCEFIWYFIEGLRYFIYFEVTWVLEVWMNTKRLKRVQSFQRQALNEILMGSVYHLTSNLPGNTTKALTRPAFQPGWFDSDLLFRWEVLFIWTTEPDQIYTQVLLILAAFIFVKKNKKVDLENKSSAKKNLEGKDT